MQSDHLLSPADEAAVESIYRRNITPWRCRLHLHHWNKWTYIFSIQTGMIQQTTGRRSETSQVNIEVRTCECCLKTEARAVRVAHPDDMDVEIEEDDEC